MIIRDIRMDGELPYLRGTGLAGREDLRTAPNAVGTAGAGILAAAAMMYDPTGGVYRSLRSAYTDGRSQDEVIGVNNGLWNGAGFDRQRSKWDTTALASAVRSTTASAIVTMYNARSLFAELDITAVPGVDTVTLNLWAYLNGGGNALLLASPAQAGVGKTFLEVGPGISEVANARAARSVPYQVLAEVVHSGAGNFTYSVNIHGMGG